MALIGQIMNVFSTSNSGRFILLPGLCGQSVGPRQRSCDFTIAGLPPFVAG
jgi:hypothetical protein